MSDHATPERGAATETADGKTIDLLIKAFDFLDAFADELPPALGEVRCDLREHLLDLARDGYLFRAGASR